MQKKISSVRDLKIGDLVYHLLHGKTWMAIILDVIEVHKDRENRSATHKELALVRMVPGTKHEFFFAKMVSKQNRITNSLGFVSTSWLFKLRKE